MHVGRRRRVGVEGYSWLPVEKRWLPVESGTQWSSSKVTYPCHPCGWLLVPTPRIEEAMGSSASRSRAALGLRPVPVIRIWFGARCTHSSAAPVSRWLATSPVRSTGVGDVHENHAFRRQCRGCGADGLPFNVVAMRRTRCPPSSKKADSGTSRRMFRSALMAWCTFIK